MASSRIIASEEPVLAVGETNIISVSFADVLNEGELLTGTPAIVEITTSDLTVSNNQINTTALTMGDHIIAIGKAVQFKLIGQVVVSSPYTMKITVLTDSTPPQTKVRGITFTVEDIT